MTVALDDLAPDGAVAGGPALRPGMRARVALALTVVVVCFHTSLWSLVRGTTVDTPLAYLGLVPFVAAALGALLSRPRPGEPEIHDRQVDRIVGVPLVVVPVLSMALLPARMSTMYWMWRLDLLVLPLFVAGVVALLFGVRMLWRTKVAVAWLVLAWPVPCRFGLTMLLEPLSRLTALTVRLFVAAVPIARPVAGDGISFAISHAGREFRVQVASACSGANSLVGFLLVAAAVAVVLQGRRSAKVRWLCTGAAFVWLLNVVRILVIIGAGRLVGRTASIEVLHPVIGMVMFGVGVLVMVLNVRRFGLDLPVATGPSRLSSVRRAVPDARRAAVLLAAVALVGAVVNQGLRAYDPIASAVGATRLGTFDQVATDPPGYSAVPVSSVDVGRRFFGEDSTWIRWSYVGEGTPELHSDVPVLADVVRTDNAQAFSDFGLEACYRFHGYGLGAVRNVNLGSGLVGTVLDWQEPATGLRWTTVYWIWSVDTPEGVQYERVVLLLNDSAGSKVRAPRVSPRAASDFALRTDELVRGRVGATVSPRQVELRTFLIAFARNVVSSATARSLRMPRSSETGG